MHVFQITWVFMPHPSTRYYGSNSLNYNMVFRQMLHDEFHFLGKIIELFLSNKNFKTPKLLNKYIIYPQFIIHALKVVQ